MRLPPHIIFRYMFGCDHGCTGASSGPSLTGFGLFFFEGAGMITEIEVEGLGVLRHLNNFQMLRVKRISDKRKRSTAIVAFGLGMTVRQFEALTTEQQRVAWEAHNRLYAPVSMQPDRTAPAPLRLPRPYERVSQDRAAQLGGGSTRHKERAAPRTLPPVGRGQVRHHLQPGAAVHACRQELGFVRHLYVLPNDPHDLPSQGNHASPGKAFHSYQPTALEKPRDQGG